MNHYKQISQDGLSVLDQSLYLKLGQGFPRSGFPLVAMFDFILILAFYLSALYLSEVYDFLYCSPWCLTLAFLLQLKDNFLGFIIGFVFFVMRNIENQVLQ